jgi:wyosine [tRNA(Phe)-imidazoG37] synthetase (radical SAM superfamily)
LEVNFLPSYLVNSAILCSGKDPRACAEGAAKMLAKGKIKDIEAKTCYCCGAENRVAFLIEGPSEDAVLHVIQEQLDIPVASIMEAEEVSVLP